MGASAVGTGPTHGMASSRTTDVASPLDAMRHGEIARIKRLLGPVLIICFAAAAALPFLGGDPTAKLVLYCGLGLTVVTSIWVRLFTTEPEQYTDARIALAWAAPTLGVCAGVYFFGVFSPAPILMLLAIYVIGMGQNRWLGLGVYVVFAAFQGTVALLIETGVLPEAGLVHADYLTGREQVIGQSLVQLVLVATYASARASRDTMLQSLEDLAQAVRAIAQREAMLQEARQDLDRAMQVGGGGQYTDRIVGSYRLAEVIGRGAMGEVYAAHHVDTGDEAAVKLLHPSVLDREGYLDRFLREVDTVSMLESPHIVQVLAVGRADAPLPYIAMERLRGKDLSHYLRTKRRLRPKRIVELVEQVGAGIEVAGAAGVVHRDIKPQNLFLASQPNGRPVWKVLDFGVSKLGGHGGTLTQGHVVGTPGYMAPEQAQGKDVDSRADLYALAAIVYRALTGLPPFRGKDVPTTLYHVVYHMPARPSDVTDLHPHVDAVMSVALAKNPDERFFRAEEFSRALAAAIEGELDEEWRRQAAKLEAKHPWGSAK